MRESAVCGDKTMCIHREGPYYSMAHSPLNSRARAFKVNYLIWICHWSCS